MLAEIEQLLVLQDRDQKIKTLRAELATIPIERKRAENLLAIRKLAFEQAKQKAQEIEIQRKKLELDVKAKQDQIAKYKTQQFQTRKNEEFQAISHEIARMVKEIAAIEDQEIELMEQGEDASLRLRQAETEFKAARQQSEQQLAALERKQGLIEERLRDTEAERERLAKEVNPDLLFRYDRLFTTKNGNPVVPIDHEVCTGCHMKNTITTVHRAKLGREIVTCEQCGRMLYRAA